MSMTKEKADDFLNEGHRRNGKQMAAADHEMAAGFLQDIINKLLNLNVSWPDIFSKAFALYAIVVGPGTWQEKAALVLSLFGQAPAIA